MSKFRELLINFKDVFIWMLGNCSGEGQIGLLGEVITRNLREKAIGKTVYRVRSLFEGKKDIDKTIERLAVKNVSASNDTQKNQTIA